MHPSLGAQTPAGTLSVEGDRIQFSDGERLVQMPLECLELEAGGHNGEQLFFRHRSQPGWILTTSDQNLLATLAGAADSELRARIGQARKQRASSSRLWGAGLAILLVVFGLVAALYSQKSKLARIAADKVPASWEQQFGEAVFQSVRQQTKIIDDPQWTNQLFEVASKLRAAIPDTGYTFHFHVAEAKELNAFAIPGGHVVVHTGLLKAVKRPEELAGVLAHEIAHVTQRHSLRNIMEKAGLSLVIQTLVGDASELVTLAASGSELLLNQKFSRDTEREADDVGWDTLLKANIDPRGMIDFFQTMQEELAKNPAGATMEGKLSLLSTHPPTAERIERLEAKWKQLGNRKFPDLVAGPRSLQLERN